MSFEQKNVAASELQRNVVSSLAQNSHIVTDLKTDGKEYKSNIMDGNTLLFKKTDSEIYDNFEWATPYRLAIGTHTCRMHRNRKFRYAHLSKYCINGYADYEFDFSLIDNNEDVNNFCDNQLDYFFPCDSCYSWYINCNCCKCSGVIADDEREFIYVQCEICGDRINSCDCDLVTVGSQDIVVAEDSDIESNPTDDFLGHTDDPDSQTDTSLVTTDEIDSDEESEHKQDNVDLAMADEVEQIRMNERGRIIREEEEDRLRIDSIWELTLCIPTNVPRKDVQIARDWNLVRDTIGEAASWADGYEYAVGLPPEPDAWVRYSERSILIQQSNHRRAVEAARHNSETHAINGNQATGLETHASDYNIVELTHIGQPHSMIFNYGVSLDNKLVKTFSAKTKKECQQLAKAYVQLRQSRELQNLTTEENIRSFGKYQPTVVLAKTVNEEKAQSSIAFEHPKPVKITQPCAIIHCPNCATKLNMYLTLFLSLISLLCMVMEISADPVYGNTNNLRAVAVLNGCAGQISGSFIPSNQPLPLGLWEIETTTVFGTAANGYGFDGFFVTAIPSYFSGNNFIDGSIISADLYFSLDSATFNQMSVQPRMGTSTGVVITNNIHGSTDTGTSSTIVHRNILNITTTVFATYYFFFQYFTVGSCSGAAQGYGSYYLLPLVATNLAVGTVVINIADNVLPVSITNIIPGVTIPVSIASTVPVSIAATVPVTISGTPTIKAQIVDSTGNFITHTTRTINSVVHNALDSWVANSFVSDPTDAIPTYGATASVPLSIGSLPTLNIASIPSVHIAPGEMIGIAGTPSVSVTNVVAVSGASFVGDVYVNGTISVAPYYSTNKITGPPLMYYFPGTPSVKIDSLTLPNNPNTDYLTRKQRNKLMHTVNGNTSYTKLSLAKQNEIKEEYEIDQNRDIEDEANYQRDKNISRLLGRLRCKWSERGALRGVNIYLVLELLQDADAEIDLQNTGLVSSTFDVSLNIGNLDEIVKAADKENDDVKEEKKKGSGDPKRNIKPILPAGNANYQEQVARVKRGISTQAHFATWLIYKRPDYRLAKHMAKIVYKFWIDADKNDWARIVIDCYLNKNIGPNSDGKEVLATIFSRGINNKLLHNQEFEDLYSLVFGEDVYTVIDILGLTQSENKRKREIKYETENRTQLLVVASDSEFEEVKQENNNQLTHSVNGNWALSGKKRNKLAHSYNGNTTESFPMTLTAIKALMSGVDLTSYIPTKAEIFNIKNAIINVSGIAPVYNNIAVDTTVMDDIVTGAVNANGTIATPIHVSAREALIYPRTVRAGGAAGGVLIADPFRLSFVRIGSTTAKLRGYTTGAIWQAASQLMAEGRLLPRIVMSNNARAMDIVLFGNGFHTGMGLNATVNKTGGADSIVAVGIRIGQYCAIYSALKNVIGLPLGGQANAVDSWTKVSTKTGNTTLTGWDQAMPNGENCGGAGANSQPFFPFGQNYESVGPDPNCCAFRVVTACSGLSPDELNHVMWVPAGWFGNTIDPSLVLAILLLILCPGPISFFSILLNTTDLNNINPALQRFVMMINLIVTQGWDNIIFLVPVQSAGLPPIDLAEAQDSSMFDFRFGPIANQNWPANAFLQISPVNNAFIYSSAAFVRSWSSYLNSNIIYNIGCLFCKSLGRLADMEMGVSISLATGTRLRPLTVSIPGNNALGLPNEDAHSRDTILFNDTRPTFVTGNFPRAEPTTYDFSVPTFSLSWVSAVLLNCIVPEEQKATTTLTQLLTHNECWQAQKYFFRSLAIAYHIFYAAMQKPVNFYNNAIFVRPSAVAPFNEYQVNNILQMETWRRKIRKLYATVESSMLLRALAAPTINKILETVVELKLPKDGFEMTIIDYTMAPQGTLTANDPQGNAEVLYAYAGIKAINAGNACESTCYVPALYTDLEIYTMAKKLPKFMSLWTLPYNADNYGLMSDDSKALMNVTLGVQQVTFPVSDVNNAVMGSEQDLRNDDNTIYSIRNWQATPNFGTTAWLYNDFTPPGLAAPRSFLQNNAVQVNICVPQIAQPDIMSQGSILSNYLYSSTTLMPTVDLSGRRWYPSVNGITKTLLLQWLSQKVQVQANALMFNRTLISIEPLIGSASKNDFSYHDEKPEQSGKLTDAKPGAEV